MSVLVETSEDEPILCVAQHIGDLNQPEDKHTALADTPSKRFVLECQALLEQAAWAPLLTKLLVQSGVLFSSPKASEKDAETCYLIISNIVTKLSGQDAVDAAKKIAASVTGEVKESTQVRLRILMSLFNLIQFPQGKLAVLLDMLKYGKEANLGDLLVGVVSRRVEQWVKDWELDVKACRALYLALAELFKDVASRDHFSFLVKYLATFEGCEVGPEEIEAEVVAAAAEFIAAPDVFHCDLLDMACVRTLHKHSKAGPIFSLLSIMLTGKQEDYSKLVKDHPKLLAEHSLNADEVMGKMRLMSLAALGAEATMSGGGSIPFTEVQRCLGVAEDQVEAWVVKAISLKLLEAKMDQVNAQLVISRTTHRVFGQPQWQELKDRMTTWKDNLNSVCKMVHNTRMSGTSALASETAAR
mmetsp:Transcript_9855/g.13376  ORF Transcript_9855/g.13376 Transcript_9855/m.13376 type:complete len:414 (-) Transcript_9855:209-1450(-)|eukprot:CAMPEP_0196581012 /NCGR_PEP_ID=MMETSP1081-20130531/31938_1 /TAXON_ID=36882 /ORGANISM="Pyramimonas amylifera, Strain CCMP720" /LENGTH=413 /DNA_ID=CAMNT_0041901089 /DNA_START=337 /DNA_END=1578 /DNA_ORIENTATION=+